MMFVSKEKDMHESLLTVQNANAIAFRTLITNI